MAVLKATIVVLPVGIITSLLLMKVAVAGAFDPGATLSEFWLIDTSGDSFQSSSWALGLSCRSPFVTLGVVLAVACDPLLLSVATPLELGDKYTWWQIFWFVLGHLSGFADRY